MRRIKLLFIIALVILSANNCLLYAQQEAASESALVYYMPQTIVVFNIEYEQITETKGIFYQYSERYLGTKDVILEDGVSYRLTKISMRTRVEADKNRCYTIPLNEKSLQNCNISLTNKGLLAGINLKAVSEQPTSKSHAVITEEEPACNRSGLVPYLEEQMRANSVAKMAESTAKQIYRIRESRLNLLSGDAEHIPSDGSSMALVLSELDKQEQALVELFTGSCSVKKKHYSLEYAPQQSTRREVLLRFSQFSGICEKDDLSGEPIYMTLEIDKPQIEENVEEKKVQMSPIFYNMPGNASLQVEYKDQIRIDKKLAIAQAGIAIPLAQDIFKKSAPEIVIDSKTGALKSIKK